MIGGLRFAISRRGLVLLIAGVAAGCARHQPDPENVPSAVVLPTSGEPEELSYAPALGVDLSRMTRTANRLYYQDILIGRGAVAASGQRVRVAYTGWLADGSMFDQSRSGRPFTFDLGEGLVIPGWDEGVAGMRVGGRRLLVIRPGLAYGTQSPGPGIPPNATLVFDVRLIEVMAD